MIMEKEFIVGIDFGHGETSAWLVPINLITASAAGEPLILRPSNKTEERSYHSVIYYNPEKGYSFDSLEANIIQGFKDKVSVLNQPQNYQKKEAYIAFIKHIYMRLIKHNTMLKVDQDGNTNFYLCIACPTKWNQDEKDAYIQFFNDALCEFGVEVLWVINESDVAYFSHGSIDKYSDKCVLIIDYGSSTIDYTVVYKGKKISDDNWSNRLGASIVEESVLNECRNFEDYQEKFENTISKLAELNLEYIDVNSCVKFETRKAKEVSVTYGNYPNLEVNYNLIGQKTGFGLTETFKAEKRKYRFEIDCQIDKCIEKYQSKVEEDFRNLNSEIQKVIGEQKVDCVILSGGACLMPWVRDAVENIFEPVNIEIDNQASFVVAKGIALYAKAQMSAFNDFLGKVSQIDFSNIYIKADTNATSKAILTLMPATSNRLKKQSSLNAIKIRKEYCDFVKNLDGDNVEYSNLVQREFDSLVSKSVAESIKDVIHKVFKIEVETSDIKLHLPVKIMSFKPSLFVEGGGFYEAFTNMIINYSNAYFGSWFFNWEKVRSASETAGIIDGIAQTLENYVKSGSLADYSDAETVIKAYAETIKEQVVNMAVDIFYKKQLFNTTFKK